MSDESTGGGCLLLILLIVAMVTCSGNEDKVRHLQSEVDQLKGRVEVLQRGPAVAPEVAKPPKPVQVESTK